MHVDRWGVGAGPAVVLVHGAMTNGEAAWSKQRPLAERWELVVVTRRGFVPNPPADRADFAVDADDLVALLDTFDEPPHLVGHSYGGLVTLVAAIEHPAAVRSLVLIEPAVMSLARGHPLVEEAISAHLGLVATSGGDPRAFLMGFTRRVGGDPNRVPDPLPDTLRQHVELLINERFPWEADLDLAPVAAASIPTLVVSGGHDPMLETVCDALVAGVGSSAQRVVLPGAAHAVQRTGEPFNEALEAFFLTS